jgi:hypothetical protein
MGVLALDKAAERGDLFCPNGLARQPEEESLS